MTNETLYDASWPDNTPWPVPLAPDACSCPSKVKPQNKHKITTMYSSCLNSTTLYKLKNQDKVHSHHKLSIIYFFTLSHLPSPWIHGTFHPPSFSLNNFLTLLISTQKRFPTWEIPGIIFLLLQFMTLRLLLI